MIKGFCRYRKKHVDLKDREQLSHFIMVSHSVHGCSEASDRMLTLYIYSPVRKAFEVTAAAVACLWTHDKVHTVRVNDPFRDRVKNRTHCWPTDAEFVYYSDSDIRYDTIEEFNVDSKAEYTA